MAINLAKVGVEGSNPFARSNLRATQVGYSRLGHYKLPISGKPEIDGASVGKPNLIAKVARRSLLTAEVRLLTKAVGEGGIQIHKSQFQYPAASAPRVRVSAAPTKPSGVT